MYPMSNMHHLSQRDLNSCRYSCHGYAHTVQYFPNGMPYDSQPSQRPQNIYEPNEYEYNQFINRSDEYQGAEYQNGNKYVSSVTNNWKKGSSGKNGQQRRCWNTANFQWMNIKRERKTSSSFDNGKVPIFTLFSFYFYS